ncbi:MAG: 30S ribosomal protein S20 [Pseudomonadota bacterium]
MIIQARGGIHLANHKSAIKRARQSEKRALRNKINKTKVKNAVKAVRASVQDSPEQTVDLLKTAMRTLDRAAARGTLHKKTASRRIARMSRMVHKAQAGAPAA